MKSTITYHCEDSDELKMVSNAVEMSLAIEDFRHYLRQQWKYAETPDDIEKIYEQFNELFHDYL